MQYSFCNFCTYLHKLQLIFYNVWSCKISFHYYAYNEYQTSEMVIYRTCKLTHDWSYVTCESTRDWSQWLSVICCALPPDKVDGSSFSRSRSSSISSLENISKEAIQCLNFADAYSRKTGQYAAKMVHETGECHLVDDFCQQSNACFTLSRSIFFWDKIARFGKC